MTDAPTPPSGPRDTLVEAEEALRAGERERAINLVGHALRSAPDRREAYDLAARALEGEDGSEAAGADKAGLLFRLCYDNFEHPGYFYKLGFNFMQADLPHLALPVLERAHTLGADDGNIRVEYAVALAENGRHADARDVLATLPRELFDANPGVRFLAGWCALLTGDAATARVARDSLSTPGAKKSIDPPLIERLTLAIDRYQALAPLAAGDLRGWHFVQYGGAILSVSDTPGMGGRFGMLLETEASLQARLAGFVDFLRAVAFDVKRVVTLPSRDAEIVGRLIAKRLPAPREAFVPHGAMTPGTLIVAANAAELGTVQYLGARSPDYLVYAHTVNWTRSAPFVPDVAGLLTQAHFFPWQRAITFDAEGRSVERGDDPRPPERVAEYVARETEDVTAIDAPTYDAGRGLSLFAGDERVTIRPAYRQESPVPAKRMI